MDLSPAREATACTPSAIWTGGGYFDFLDPRPEDIRIEDIARALSRQPRYNGLGTVRPWSIGQHSLLCHDFAVEDGITDPQTLLDILAHDFPEAFTGDIVSPLKALLPDFKAIEARVWAAVCARFKTRFAPPPEVKRYDLIALSTEKHGLISRAAGRWSDLPAPRIIPLDLLCATEREVTETLCRLASHYAAAL